MEGLGCCLDSADPILPDAGLVAMVLPAYAFQTPSRVSKWMDRFAIDVNMIPRTLFPGLSKPLVWAKYTKTSQRRFSGTMLFAEPRSIDQMRSSIRAALARPGTCRQAIASALESLIADACQPAFHDAISPHRQYSLHRRPKIPQPIQRNYQT